MRGGGVEHAHAGLFHDVVHDFLQVPGFVVNLKLAVGAAAHFQHFVDVFDFVARSQFVDNVVDARSGTVRVRASFENTDGALIPGQFARMRLGQPKPEPVIAITERAIGTDQDRRHVTLLGPDGKTAYRPVQLGGISDGLRIVTSGLEPGEHIVVNGLQRIRPGSVVAPQVVPMVQATALAGR